MTTSTPLAPATAGDLQMARRLLGVYDGPTTLSEMVQLASILARAEGGIVPELYHGNPEAVVALFYACRALNIPVWAGLHELFKGKDGGVGKKAILVRALWMRHGIEYDFEATDTECTGWIRRPGEDRRYEVEYTILDAERLGLIERNPEWDRQPKAMLVARWTTTTATRWTPNIVLGMGLDDPGADPAGPGDGWNTDQEIGPEVVRVLEEAGRAVGEGEGVEGLRRIWDSNAVLLDEWAGDGQSLRQALTDLITAEAVKGLPEEGRPHPGDAGRTGGEDGEPRTGGQDQEGAAAAVVSDAGELACGCPLADVLTSGKHPRPDCVLNG
ncbi:hypothetical protein [Streptomyces albogriseolus]|uniref:hypothetical protein n=1 Tax=Streptomyces albogriseolus TaxID=1887 RepID=UPI00345F5CAF